MQSQVSRMSHRVLDVRARLRQVARSQRIWEPGRNGGIREAERQHREEIRRESEQRLWCPELIPHACGHVV